MAPDNQGIVAKVKARFARVRQRYPFLDHLALMVQYYGKIQGNVLGGAVTYFGFLSFFPVLAVAFAVVGYVAIAYPGAKDSLTTAITQIFPGIITTTAKPGAITIQQISSAKAAAGIIGFVGVLYSGLGWLSGMREGLTTAFAIPPKEKPNFVIGKLTDLAVLGILGVVLVLTVGVSGVVNGLTGRILVWVHLDGTLIGKPLVYAVATVLGLAASTFLFFVLYRLLGRPDAPVRAVWQGALLGAAGFEILKWLVVNVLGGVGGSAFAPLAIAVTLVVWINYFSRLVFYGASWAMTARHTAAMRRRTDRALDSAAVAGPTPQVTKRYQPTETTRSRSPAQGGFDTRSALVGAVLGAVAAVVLRRD